MRYLWLAICAALILGGSNAAAQTSWAPPSGGRLRDLAEKAGFLIGNAMTNDFWKLPDAEIYQQVAKSEFNIITPEGQMKFWALHPEPQRYYFGNADRYVQFALDHGMKVHGHTLVWQNPGVLPPWLTGRTWTRDELLSVLYDHIDKVMGHYAGKVAVWDVVNEAFNRDGTYRQGIWFDTIGPDYIPLAFVRARQADPSAKLIYNDDSDGTINLQTDAVYKLLSNLRRNGVPVDGVGIQMHVTSTGKQAGWLKAAPDMRSLAANMVRFAALGLEIYITEMDVSIQGPPTPQSLDQQARIYRDVLRACLAQPACKGLQTWGLTDKYSWVPTYSNSPGYGSPLLFDENYRPKPAYFAIQDELKKGR